MTFIYQMIHCQYHSVIAYPKRERYYIRILRILRSLCCEIARQFRLSTDIY
jgi:hypothetical protein